MATATNTYETRTVQKTITVEERVPTITLTLSTDEAETLRAILCRISGSPDSSPREHTDFIDEALRDAGVRDWALAGHPHELVNDERNYSGILFDDYPAEVGAA